MRHDFNTLHLLWAIRDIPSCKIKSTEKIILYTFLASTNYKNDLWYNQESLCEMTGLTKNTLKKHLISLEQKKFITITKPTTYGRSASNHYSLNIEHILMFCRPIKGSNYDTLNEKKVSNFDEKGSNFDSKRGENLTLKKEIEERKEESAFALPKKSAKRSEKYEGIPMPEHVKERIYKALNKKYTPIQH